MHPFNISVTPPCIRLRHEIGHNSIERGHALKFAMHHSTALLVQSNFEEERRRQPIRQKSFEMRGLCPETGAMGSDFDDLAAIWQF